jgi:tetratricopeptide (TPR) repeat protein/predicted Ser/Thr protein kinase
MSSPPTDSHADSTDERSGLSHTERSQRPAASFEHRRMIATARERLFGVRSKLYIGRFEVEARLGAGGMGEVYLGVDEQLGRKVALKRVLADVGDPRAQERLRREARALAKLSHANVVQIYEIGEHEERLFLAMEYVEGQTLGEWLAAVSRPWRAIVEHFVAAGRGLAAAHRAGVVHRDFKPDNVLIGRAGEVRVADFGLALAEHELRPLAQASVGPGLAVGTRLSTTGAVIGTIRYMPLEQLLGETVDERSDQFAFCVALYEALWGQPPFDIMSSHARLSALEQGEPIVPALRGVPAGIWRALRRGLARAPDQRWPDMGGLLDALVAAAARSRRRVWLGGVLGLGLAVGMLAWSMHTPDEATTPAAAPPACSEVARELDGVWDAARRDALAARLDASPLEHGAATRERVIEQLERWSGAWVSERTRVCEAGEAGSLAPELVRLESLCLVRGRRQAGELVDALLAAPPRELGGAIEASAELSDPHRCADELALLGVAPPPRAIEGEVEQLRGDVLHAHDLRLLGHVDQALERIEQTRERAEALDHGPLLAEVLGEQAKAEFVAGTRERAAELLAAAIAEAEAHHHDRLAADLLSAAALHYATDFEDAAEAARWLARAEVAWQRVEPDPRSEARMALARGLIAKLDKRVEQAEAAFADALARSEGHDWPEIPAIHSALADLLRRSAPERSMAAREQALTSAERHWGPAHPETAFYVYKLGHALERAGEHERGRALITRAATTWTEALERPHPQLATARATLAQIALGEGRYDDAEQQAALLEQAQRALPAEHRDRGEPELIRATTAAMRGDRASALLHAERALAYWQPTLGDEHPRVIHVETEIANHLLGLGRLDEAAPRYAALLARAPTPERALPIYLNLAELELRRGQLDRCRSALEALEALDAPLGANALSHAVLRATLALRSGASARREIAALREVLVASKVDPALLAGWLDELGLTPDEREQLGLVTK